MENEYGEKLITFKYRKWKKSDFQGVLTRITVRVGSKGSRRQAYEAGGAGKPPEP